MELLYNTIIADVTTDKKRICINDSIDIWFNNVEFWCGAIVFLLDDEPISRLELHCDFKFKICVDSVYVDFIV